MGPVPHLERIIDKDDASRLIVRPNLLSQSRTKANKHMHTRHRARTITPHMTVVLTEPPNSLNVSNATLGVGELNEYIITRC